MIDSIFIVLLISGVFNFWYIWFHGKNEKVCKRLIKVSSIFLLPRVLQSFYSFTLENPVFSSTLFIVLGFLLNLVVTSLLISFINPKSVSNIRSNGNNGLNSIDSPINRSLPQVPPG